MTPDCRCGTREHPYLDPACPEHGVIDRGDARRHWAAVFVCGSLLLGGALAWVWLLLVVLS